MRGLFIILLVLCAAVRPDPAAGELYLVRGDMASTIAFGYEQQVVFPAGAKSLSASFVAPRAFSSPTTIQQIRDFSIVFDPAPDQNERSLDERGNSVVTVSWDNPPKRTRVNIAFTADTATRLKTIDSTAPYPPARIPEEVAVYVRPTQLVQSDAAPIRALSRELVAGAATQYEAARRLVEATSERLRYVNPPKRYDALFSLDTGTGNCQNYSHLAAALLRAAGIPARIVNGFTVSAPYTVASTAQSYTFKSASGRHSWIEAWFPDLGWVPFDPQKTSFFVANRFIRVEVGVDNAETVKDGRILFTRASDQGGPPRLTDQIAAEFVEDAVRLTGSPVASDSRRLMLLAEVTGRPEHTGPALPTPEPEQPPASPTPGEPQARPRPSPPPQPAMPAEPLPPGPAVFGNLDFPENVDFTDYGTARDLPGNRVEITRNFLVESAQYVTTRLMQYAQAFRVDRPLKLSTLELALHRYGGGGTLWLELLRDDGGRPGEMVAASDLLDATSLSLAPGYRWAVFDFSAEPATLAPGLYWMALGFTGDPIVNWFYTYGKPVGPVFGTRYRDAFEEKWSGALDFEFNYRVSGTWLQEEGA